MVNRENSNSHTNDQYTEKRIADSGEMNKEIHFVLLCK